jgi:hypothetical protein
VKVSSRRVACAGRLVSVPVLLCREVAVVFLAGALVQESCGQLREPMPKVTVTVVPTAGPNPLSI